MHRWESFLNLLNLFSMLIVLLVITKMLLRLYKARCNNIFSTSLKHREVSDVKLLKNYKTLN